MIEVFCQIQTRFLYLHTDSEDSLRFNTLLRTNRHEYGESGESRESKFKMATELSRHIEFQKTKDS